MPVRKKLPWGSNPYSRVPELVRRLIQPNVSGHFIPDSHQLLFHLEAMDYPPDLDSADIIPPEFHPKVGEWTPVEDTKETYRYHINSMLGVFRAQLDDFHYELPKASAFRQSLEKDEWPPELKFIHQANGLDMPKVSDYERLAGRDRYDEMDVEDHAVCLHNHIKLIYINAMHFAQYLSENDEEFADAMIVRDMPVSAEEGHSRDEIHPAYVDHLTYQFRKIR